MKLFFEEGKIPSEKIVRFSAIECKDGAEGCMRSHIEVLKLAKQNNWGTILIFEDDVEWEDFDGNYKKLEGLIRSNTWDVFLLGGKYLETDDIKRVKRGCCAHAYIVNEFYRNILVKNYEECLYKRTHPAKLSFLQISKSWLTLDFYWFKLQIKDTWLGMIPSMCNQRYEYSNIMNGYISHTQQVFSESQKACFITLQDQLINNPLY